MSLPIVSITAPSPCTLKQLGIELLRLLGYPIDRDVREQHAICGHDALLLTRSRNRRRHNSFRSAGTVLNDQVALV